MIYTRRIYIHIRIYLGPHVIVRTHGCTDPTGMRRCPRAIGARGRGGVAFSHDPTPRPTRPGPRARPTRGPRMPYSTARIPSSSSPLPTLRHVRRPLAANDTRASAHAPSARPVVLTPTPLPPPASGGLPTAPASRLLPCHEGDGGGSGPRRGRGRRGGSAGGV
jgi:hypothetical protein